MSALAVTTDVLLPVGAVAAGIGIGMLIWSHKTMKKHEKQRDLSVRPIIGKSTALLSMSGRF